MRGYSVAASALAIGVEPKWLDNLLSQNRVPGVVQARQGVPRRIPPSALYLIATAHGLNRDFQVPVGAALRLAQAIWESPNTGAVAAFAVEDLSLQVDREALKSRVDQAVAEAIEMAPRPKRGRPPKTR